MCLFYFLLFMLLSLDFLNRTDLVACLIFFEHTFFPFFFIILNGHINKKKIISALKSNNKM